MRTNENTWIKVVILTEKAERFANEMNHDFDCSTGWLMDRLQISLNSSWQPLPW